MYPLPAQVSPPMILHTPIYALPTGETTPILAHKIGEIRSNAAICLLERVCDSVRSPGLRSRRAGANHARAGSTYPEWEPITQGQGAYTRSGSQSRVASVGAGRYMALNTWAVRGLGLGAALKERQLEVERALVLVCSQKTLP
eukprot:1183539-Prorocentrum_minimum.AAC.8